MRAVLVILSLALVVLMVLWLAPVVFSGSVVCIDAGLLCLAFALGGVSGLLAAPQRLPCPLAHPGRTCGFRLLRFLSGSCSTSVPQTRIVWMARLILRYPPSNSNQMTRPALAKPSTAPSMGASSRFAPGVTTFFGNVLQDCNV